MFANKSGNKSLRNRYSLHINNIGVTYSSKGDNQKAIEHYKKCLDTQVKIKGVDSIDVAKTLNNIG
jgi:hypothetical protein